MRNGVTRLLFAFLVSFGAACTEKRDTEKKTQAADADQAKTKGENGESAEDPKGEPPKPEPPKPETQCASTQDCKTCPTRDCGCVAVSGTGQCPPTMHGCMVPPCGWRTSYCSNDRCVLLPAHGPCNEDADCEARKHPWRCEYVPVRADAPRLQSGHACGGMPKPPEVRCEPKAQRCMFADDMPPPEPPVALPKLELRWTCEMHGTAITKRSYAVRSEPPSITVTDNDEPSRKAALDPVDLGTLRRLLNSPGFEAFLAESPESSPAHPGMELCSLELTSPEDTKKKKWKRGDAFSESAEIVRKAISTELRQLAESENL